MESTNREDLEFETTRGVILLGPLCLIRPWSRGLKLLGIGVTIAIASAFVFDLSGNRAQASCAIDGVDPRHPGIVFTCPAEIIEDDQGIWTGCNRVIRVDVVEWSFDFACKQVPPCAPLTCPNCPDDSCSECWTTAANRAIGKWDDALNYYGNPNIVSVGSSGDIVYQMLIDAQFIQRFGDNELLIAITSPVSKSDVEICCGPIKSVDKARIWIRNDARWTLANDNAGGLRKATTHGAKRYAVHEMGHALNLKHGGASDTSIMSFSANGSAPKSLDLLAMKCLYAKSFSCCTH